MLLGTDPSACGAGLSPGAQFMLVKSWFAGWIERNPWTLWGYKCDLCAKCKLAELNLSWVFLPYLRIGVTQVGLCRKDLACGNVWLGKGKSRKWGMKKLTPGCLCGHLWWNSSHATPSYERWRVAKGTEMESHLPGSGFPESSDKPKDQSKTLSFLIIVVCVRTMEVIEFWVRFWNQTDSDFNLLNVCHLPSKVAHEGRHGSEPGSHHILELSV